MYSVSPDEMDLSPLKGDPVLLRFLHKGGTVKARHPSLHHYGRQQRTVIVYLTGGTPRQGQPVKFQLTVSDFNTTPGHEAVHYRAWVEPEFAREMVEATDEKARYELGIDHMTRLRANSSDVRVSRVDPIRTHPLPAGVSLALI